MIAVTVGDCILSTTSFFHINFMVFSGFFDYKKSDYRTCTVTTNDPPPSIPTAAPRARTPAACERRACMVKSFAICRPSACKGNGVGDTRSY